MSVHLLSQMSNRRIIALTGQRSSGKDAVADIIDQECRVNDKRCIILPLAYPLKVGLYHMLSGLDSNAIFGSSADRSKDSSFLDDQGKPIPVRKLLTSLGNDWGRGLSKTFWLQVLAHRIQIYEPDALIVVSDVRYENEIKALNEVGASIWRIRRGKRSRWNHLCDNAPVLHRVGDMFGASPHESEREMWYRRVDKYVTREIDNNDTLDNLQSTVVRYLQESRL